MPVHTNSIAALTAGGSPIGGQTYQFVDLSGVILLSTTTIEAIQRPTIGSTLFRRLPQHGRPFQLVSANYVLDWDAARVALAAYDALKNVDFGVRITKQSQVYLDAARVLDVVEAQPPQAVSKVVGSLVPDAQVLHVVQWTLMFP